MQLVKLPSRPLRPLARSGALALLVGLALAGCGDSPTPPGSLRFGQIGEVRLELEVPLGANGQGELQQTLTWDSRGPWKLTETVSYRGLLGDRNTTLSTVNPEVLAGTYAQWITEINESAGLVLFVDELDPDLDPTCGQPRTRLTLRIRDDSRDEETAWTRCADGTLGTLTSGDAGPDPLAGRVAEAARLVRDYTLGIGFQSAFRGSVPFGSLTRSEDSEADLTGPLVVRDDAEWRTFWRAHTGTQELPPTVDFDEDMVLVASVGSREEAGDSVEIRRVLPVDPGTFVEQVLRVPGDFCSPATRTHTPVHVVITPRVPPPVEFLNLAAERVPCGR